MKHIVIINGPNMNLLGKRPIDLYGSVSFEEYLTELRREFADLQITYFQTNHEGRIIDLLQEYGYVADGIVLNAAGYTHTSVAIRDAIEAIKVPVVEVHLTNIRKREPFRQISLIEPVCIATIIGKGLKGYNEAINILTRNSQ